MNPNDYQREALRTEASHCKAAGRLEGSYQPSDPVVFPNDHPMLKAIRLLQGTNGVASELGEITSLVQKRYWYGKDITDAEMAAKIKDEVGDVCWHLMQILSAFGVSFGDVLEANLAKLKARYPNAGWEQAACENRDRDAEAKAQRDLSFGE